MRRGLLLIAFLLFVAGTAGYLLAQDAPDEPRRRRGDRRFPRPDRMRLPKIATSAMELDGNCAYCVVGTVIYKVSIDKMEVIAKQELEPSADKPPTPEDVIKRFDGDGDGKISKEEFPNAEMFDRLDRDGDGFLTKEEIPGQLLRRMAGQQRRSPFLSPPLIRFSKEKVVVLLGNTVYKLSKSDLTLEGAVQLEPEGTIGKEPKKEGKKEKKEEEDDFGF